MASSPEILIPNSASTPPPTPQPPAAAASTPPPAAADPTPTLTPTSTPAPAPDAAPAPAPAPANPTPNPPAVVAPPPPQFTPSFRPVGAPPAPPQFSPVVNPGFQNPSFSQNPTLPPPGVTFAVPGSASGAGGAVTVSVQPVPPPGVYYPPPGQPQGVPPRQYWQQPNGYVTPPTGQTPMMMAPPGVPRYPTPYPVMVRPGFPPRPPMPINVVPTISRPPIPGVSGAHVIPPMVRPILPIIAPVEKPQTTVYVGKIAPTVENSFLLPLLELCGPVKNWKPAQNPSDGSLRGFGFCEFESAEGVLRALRLLTKLNLDGQELVLNVNQATREYLERYVEKKTEREKLKEAEADSSNSESETFTAEKPEKQSEEQETRDDDAEDKDKQVDIHKFGIVTDEDREMDKDAVEKLKKMIEERLKAKPLPPPPPVKSDGSSKVNAEVPTKSSRDGDAEVDTIRSAGDKMDEDISSDNKVSNENDKTDVNSSDKARRRERSRERDRERDLMKREKERELERYERERERERVRREREREQKMREAERLYKDRVKEWEAREREREHQRHYEREREKDRESKRHREIMDQEEESDDDDIRKRRRRAGMIEERRRKRQREKEEDTSDRLKEEDEIVEAKKRAAEEQELRQKLKYESELMAIQMVNGNDEADALEEKKDIIGNVPDEGNEADLAVSGSAGDNIERNGADESNVLPEIKQQTISSRKLGFGIVSSGKKSSVPSIFNEEDDEDTDDKKMRLFVPIDYTEEPEVPENTSGTPSNLVAAAEYAKRISGSSAKEERAISDKDRSRRSTERHRDRVRYDDNHKHTRDDSRDQVRERNLERDRERGNKKLLDAKQLIDTIPKTKEELFSYDINWAVYDKHDLHERMRPWITKKITDFLGEEETSLVDYIVSSTNNHVKASDMLELLQSILDEEAEMFVLKMWRMLIFEIKKVETGLSLKSKA